MEFLRFASSIPGSYWGCCACCVIQNFNVDPDAKGSIQLVEGDGGSPLTNKDGYMFAGPTYRDIFWQRLRYGTFSTDPMPSHGFIAIITRDQIRNGYGKKWLALLKEAGFEFIRSISNSVYVGSSVGTKPGGDSSPNYVFALFRNIGRNSMTDPYKPPKEWTDLEKVVPEAWEYLVGGASEKLTQEQFDVHKQIWNDKLQKRFLSEKELTDLGVTITYAGKRSEYPQESKASRERKEQAKAAPKQQSLKTALAH